MFLAGTNLAPQLGFEAGQERFTAGGQWQAHQGFVVIRGRERPMRNFAFVAQLEVADIVLVGQRDRALDELVLGVGRRSGDARRIDVR